MRYSPFLSLIAIIVIVAAGLLYFRASHEAPSGRPDAATDRAAKPKSDTAEDPSVDLNATQLKAVTVAPLESQRFTVTRGAVGSIDFNQDRLVQVFTPYQGRLIALFAQIGDAVKAGQPLFTVDSADLLQAEATLVQAAGVLDLTNATLTRNLRLLPAGGGAQKDIDQSRSDQQTAEGNLKAARHALKIFGKEDADIDRIVKERQVDSTLVVRSPIDGFVTARNGAPGLFIQPGNAPAPFNVADLSTKWMNASVVESDSSAFKLGQEVQAKVSAFPDRLFEGRVTAIGANIDPAIHRFLVRSEIKDPDQLLRPGMFSSFEIVTSPPFMAPGIPLNGVVREGDGTMTIWVTRDQRHFTRRVIQVGLQQNGFDEVRGGAQVGETVVTDGAVFLSNMLELGAAAD